MATFNFTVAVESVNQFQ